MSFGISSCSCSAPPPLVSVGVAVEVVADTRVAVAVAVELAVRVRAGVVEVGGRDGVRETDGVTVLVEMVEALVRVVVLGAWVVEEVIREVEGIGGAVEVGVEAVV